MTRSTALATHGGSALALFYDADRRWRSPEAAPRDVLERALALRSLGFESAAAADLRAARSRWSSDLGVLRWFVEEHPDAAERRAAARIAVADHRVGRATRAAAVSSLLSSGDIMVGHAWRRGGRVDGWLAWSGRGSPTIDVAGIAAAGRLRVGRPRVSYPHDDVRCATFSVPADPAAPIAIRTELDGRPGPVLAVYPARAPDPVGGKGGRAVALTVVVPVYGDPASLEACLDALRDQRSADVDYILVDDASPDPDVSRLAALFCSETGGARHRMPVNGGFAAAVNAGLVRCAAGDVLILNSDVVLPPGALDRLRSAASCEAGIGTVSPLSNDAGSVSFPDPSRGSAPLPPSGALAVDAAAADLLAGQVVDVLAPLGSCLYATRACLDRVPFLSPAYGRGYYEDVELHLRAAEVGLRNVAACDVYVSHLGGRSFGAEKGALVDCNHAIIRHRFPGYEAADAAFDRADPLRRCRSAVEERLATRHEGAVLLVARAGRAEALLRDRRRFWTKRGRSALTLWWRPGATGVAVDVAAVDGFGPRSLGFELDAGGGSRTASYIARVGAVEVEVLEPEPMPDPVVALLRAVGLPVRIVVDSLSAVRAAVPGGAFETELGSGPAAVARDRLARACLASAGLEDPTPPVPRPARVPLRDTGIVTLGVLMPQPCPRAERVTLSLARGLRQLRQPTRLVVLGSAIDPAQLMSPGNVWVSGPLVGDDPAAVAAHHAVEALFSPYRTELFWYVEEVARRVGRPKAYFDWSDGRAACDEGDLALVMAADAEVLGKSVAAWCGPPAAASNGAGR